MSLCLSIPFSLSFSLFVSVSHLYSFRMGKDDSPIGVTRSLTEVFTLLRGNSHHVQFSYSNDGYGAGSSRAGKIFYFLHFSFLLEEKMSLVELEEGNETAGVSQPMWIHTNDEVEFEFGR